MRSLVTGFMVVLCAYLDVASTALGQKGVGDLVGVARQATKPEVVSLSGNLVEVKTGPCESTTGRSPIGTHIILETAPEQQVNIHLGPAAVVADTVARLTVGQPLAVRAFRTEKMKPNHYVAQSLTFDKTTVELRDALLRPVWARGGFGPRGATAGQAGPGWCGGPGLGRGPVPAIGEVPPSTARWVGRHRHGGFSNSPPRSEAY